jgi:hypothetical protein
MQRPVMHPQYLDDLDSEPKRAPRFARIKRLLRLGGRILLTEMFFWRSSAGVKIEDAPPFVRFVRGLLYRLAFVPIFVVIVVAAIVYSSTHPPVSYSRLDPGAQNMYFNPIDITSADGVKLNAWVVPVIDARKILEQREGALRSKKPGVVLVHDYAANREQMLPLVRPLHDAGIVVMLVGLRGTGSGLLVGQTFGFNESQDVNAAIEALRKQPMVDAGRIAVLGTGSGATAAVLAAQRDPAIRAMVLHNAIRTADELVDRLGPSELWLKWLNPLCKWTFELSYRVDVNELSNEHFAKAIEGRQVLVFKSPTGSLGTLSRKNIDQATAFLADRLSAEPKVAELPKN